MTTKRLTPLARRRCATLVVALALACCAALTACDSGVPTPEQTAADSAGAASDTLAGGDTPDMSPAASEGTPRTTGDTTPQATRVTVYFSRDEAPVAVPRAAPEGTPLLEAALRALLRGPTEAERAAGIHSWFSDTTAGALRSAEVDDRGRAVVDFTDLRQLIPNASASAGSAMLLRELNATVFAVPGVHAVEYRLNGSCEAFWEWLQYGGCRVQERG